jgi:uncharacterized membrane protein YesL
VRFLRLVGSGLKDTYSQFLPLVLYSVVWWICILLVIPGPPATVTLFSLADPRRAAQIPDWEEARTIFAGAFKRSWLIAIIFVPIELILIIDLIFFGGSQGLGILTPLWTLMTILVAIIGMYAFAVAGTMESGWKNAFRGAFYLLISRPFRSLFLFILVFALEFVMLFMVVPFILLGPGLVASIINRFTLDGLNVDVPDPNAPTEERSIEKVEKGDGHRGFLAGWRRNDVRGRG